MELIKLLEKLSHVKVLVMGDFMLDHYIWGDVHRISPEAPVPVVQAVKDTYTAGGAANVALNLANLAINTSVIGYCSTDEAGKKLNEIFDQNKIRCLINNYGTTTPTIIKTRVIIRGQQLCRIDREANRDNYIIDNHSSFDDVLNAALADADAVIISDYAKGVITQSLVDKVLAHKRHKDGSMLTAIDPKPSRRLNFKGIGLVTPNRNEAMELSELGGHNSDEKYPLDEICKAIHTKYEPRLLVVTLGAEGMAICNEGIVTKKMPTEAKQVFDVSGAGDTVISVLTASLAAGASPMEAASLANIAAGCVVSHMGTAPITHAELKEAIRHYEEDTMR